MLYVPPPPTSLNQLTLYGTKKNKTCRLTSANHMQPNVLHIPLRVNLGGGVRLMLDLMFLYLILLFYIIFLEFFLVNSRFYTALPWSTNQLT
jgi:hypothetical protein